MIGSVVFHRAIVFLPIHYVFKPFLEKTQIIVKIHRFEARLTKKNEKKTLKQRKKV